MIHASIIIYDMPHVIFFRQSTSLILLIFLLLFPQNYSNLGLELFTHNQGDHIMSLNVTNCPTCGDVFQKNFRDMCMKCSTKLDDQLNRCIKYLWKNPKSTTDELSAALDIDTSILIKFIKKGAFSKVFPNLKYPCDSCASPITDNRLCSKCMGAFRNLAQQFKTPKPLVNTRGSGFKIGDRLRNKI